MKIKNILAIGGILVTLTTITSCDDKLSALPTQSKVDGNLIVDQKSAEYALNGIYYQYAQCKTDNYNIESTGCSSLYEIYPANVAGTIVYYQGPYMFETHGGPYYEMYNSYIWLPFYQQLAAANSVIDQVKSAPDSWFNGNRKNEILGEASFMRALIHYNILRMFGYYWDIDSPYGAIIRTEPSTSHNLSKPRNTVKETYDAIMDDLEFAINNMPEENPNYYANVWVAKGLKVRVLMMRGQGNDYADAASLALDIIENGPYELEPHTTDIFHTKGLSSTEVMFGIQPKSNQTDVLEAYYYRETPQWLPSDNFIALFENDPRKAELFLEQEVTTSEYVFEEDGSYHLETVVKIFNTICKHMPPTALYATDTEESQYQMRLGEMYLLRAEALARTNNLPEAKNVLRTVMEHAGITDFTELDNVDDEHAFMQVYFNEYLKNLFCESGREWDIMMRMPSDIVLDFNPEYANIQYSIFPIPSDEFKHNYSLTKDDQNPGYSIAGA